MRVRDEVGITADHGAQEWLKLLVSAMACKCKSDALRVQSAQSWCKVLLYWVMCDVSASQSAKL